VSLAVEVLFTIPEHASSPPDVSWVAIGRSLALCSVFKLLFVLLSLFFYGFRLPLLVHLNFSEIITMRHAQNGEPNNLKFFGSKKTNGQKQDIEAWSRSSTKEADKSYF
jgi:hypothetical protein